MISESTDTQGQRISHPPAGVHGAYSLPFQSSACPIVAPDCAISDGLCLCHGDTLAVLDTL
jgi:hypothetical protein